MSITIELTANDQRVFDRIRDNHSEDVAWAVVGVHQRITCTDDELDIIAELVDQHGTAQFASGLAQGFRSGYSKADANHRTMATRRTTVTRRRPHTVLGQGDFTRELAD